MKILLAQFSSFANRKLFKNEKIKFSKLNLRSNQFDRWIESPNQQPDFRIISFLVVIQAKILSAWPQKKVHFWFIGRSSEILLHSTSEWQPNCPEKRRRKCRCSENVCARPSRSCASAGAARSAWKRRPSHSCSAPARSYGGLRDCFRATMSFSNHFIDFIHSFFPLFVHFL